MLKVSDNFKKACNSDKLKYREFIIIDNKEIDIKGNLSATAYKDTTFFGKFNLKMLTFETENDIDYKGKEFVYYKEVDGESIKIGTFIVTEIKDSDTFESVNVTAYDYGLNFANPYKSALNYKSNKITMLQVAQEICANCGVELENTSLPNGDFIVDDNQFINDEQFGDVVCLISLENGTFATINENDKLEFIFKKETEGMTTRLSTEDSKDLLTEDDNYIVVSDMDIIDDYVDLDDKRDTRPITCVLVATNKDLEEAGAIRKDQSLIDKYGENWLKIYDYAFAYSSEKCEKLVDAIFNQVKGFGYSSFETNYSFKPYLQLGDEIKFRNKNGDLVKSVILKIESNYDEIKLSAPSIINASVEYDLPQSEEELIKGAMISVNRANAEIVLKVNSNGQIAQARLDGNADDGTLFEVKADNIKLEGYTTINKGFSVDIDGNATMKNGKFNGGTIEIDDLGKNSAYSLLMYDSNNSSTIERNIRIDDVLSGKTIKTNFPENPSSIMYTALTPIELITTSYGKIIYNKSTVTGVMEEIYITKNNDTSYKETIYYQENYLVAINKKNFILPKDFGTVTSIKSSIPYSLITTDFLNTEQYLGINSGTIMIKDKNNNIDTNYSSNGMIIKNSNGRVIVEPNLIEIDMKGRIMYMSTDDAFYEGDGENAPLFQLNSAFSVYSTGKFTNNSGFDVDRYGNVTCFSLTQTSLEENKKNFEIYNDALKEIKNIDIYKYNLKDEKDGSKKHLGFVIGDNFNYSKLVTSSDNRGVDNYSFTSLCLQAIKEQQEQIEALQNQINELKEMINNGKYKD